MGKNWKILGNYKLSSREVTKYSWEITKKNWKSVGKIMKLLRKKVFFIEEYRKCSMSLTVVA